MGRKIEGPAAGAVRDFIPAIEIATGEIECIEHGLLSGEACAIGDCELDPIDVHWSNAEDSDPVTVAIRAPSMGDKRRMYQAARKQVVGVDSDGERSVSMEMNDEALHEAAILACVVSVKNYWGSDGVAIETAQQLLDHGDMVVVMEVSTEITTAWSVIEKERRSKKLGGRSDSMPPVITPLISTVESASAAERATSEIATADRAAALS